MRQAILDTAGGPVPVTYYAEIPYVNQTVVNIAHNRGFYPVVTVLDDLNDEVECEVYQNPTKNDLVVSFAIPTTGTIVIRGASLPTEYLEQPFVNTMSVLVNHNFAKYPSVTVMDDTNTEVECSVLHNSRNQTTVTFTALTSGTVVVQL